MATRTVRHASLVEPNLHVNRDHNHDERYFQKGEVDQIIEDAGFASKDIFIVGDGSSTQIDVVHLRNSYDVITSVRLALDNTEVVCGVSIPSASSVRLTFNQAPEEDEMKVVVIG